MERTKYWSSKKLDDKEIQRLWKMRQEGKTLTELAKSRGTTPSNIGLLFKSRGLNPNLEKICEIPECRKKYIARKSLQRTCSRKHLKLLMSREEANRTSSLLECALPECEKEVWMVHTGDAPGFSEGIGGSGKRFCSTVHADMHGRRKKNNVYLRILGKGPKCIVPKCTERVVLDEHHIEWCRKNGSDKTSRTVHICPTHHQQVHRGYAEFCDGNFVNLIPKIRKGLKRKRRVFDGYTWTEAK